MNTLRHDLVYGLRILAKKPLFTLVGMTLWVEGNFKESQLRNMRPGQRVTIRVDAYRQSYRGHVDSIGGATAAKFSDWPS